MLEAILLGSFIIVPLLFAWFLGSRRERWSTRKTVLVAASPVASFVALPCLVLIVVTLLTPPERCGVDACGMTLMFSFFGIGAAILGFVIGMLSAGAGVFLANRIVKRVSESDIFE